MRETQVQFAPFDVDYRPVHRLRDQRRHQVGHQRLPVRRLTSSISNNDLRGDSSTTAARSRSPPIEPEKRYGVYLGGPVIKDRLFLFGAYEHQEAGQSQDEGPVRRRLREPRIGGVTVAQFDEISQVLSSVYGIDTGPLVTNRAVHERPLLRARRLADHRQSPPRSDLPAARGSRRSSRTISPSAGRSARPSSVATPSSSAAPSRITIRPACTRTGPTSSRPSCATRAPRCRTCRIRSAAAKRRATTPSRASSSASTTRRVPMAPSVPARASPALPTICARRSSSTARSRSSMPARTSLKIGGEINSADLFNLFVQNATGTLYFRNINDLKQGLLSPAYATRRCNTRHDQQHQTCQHRQHGQRRDRGRVSATSRRPATSTTRRPISTAASIRRSPGRLADQRPAERGARRARRLVHGGHPEREPAVLPSATASANTTSFSNIDPIVMPRVALTYDLDDFSVFGRAPAAGWRRHLLWRRPAGVVRQRLPERWPCGSRRAPCRTRAAPRSRRRPRSTWS